MALQNTRWLIAALMCLAVWPTPVQSQSAGGDALPDEEAEERANRDGLSVLAYNLTRVMNIIGIRPLIQAMGA